MKRTIKNKIICCSIMSFACFWTGLGNAQDGSWRGIGGEGQPTQRHENGAVSYGNKLYLIGGRGNLPVDVYDPSSNSWSELSGPPIEMHHMQPVVYNDKIYIVGAFTGGYPGETPVPSVWVLDPSNGSWEEGHNIPEDRRRGSAGAVVHNNKIYVISGIVDGHQGGNVAWTDVYDPTTGEWTQLADAPRTRDHFHAGLYNGKIYSVAGRNTREDDVFGNTVSEVDVYDIASGSWSTTDQNIPTPRAGNSVAVLGDELFVIGGESMAQMEAHKETEVLNMNDHTWKTVAPMNVGRHGTQAVVIGNDIYMSCGSNARGASEVNSTEAFSYEIVGIKEGLANKLNFKAFPNPFVDRINFEFTSSGSEDLRISIYDITGALIQEVYNGKAVPGSKMTISYEKGHKLKAGIYFTRLQLGEESLNYKILLK